MNYWQKQSTESYFSADLRKFTNTITDIGSKLDVIREGGLLYLKTKTVFYLFT